MGIKIIFCIFGVLIGIIIGYQTGLQTSVKKRRLKRLTEKRDFINAQIKQIEL